MKCLKIINIRNSLRLVLLFLLVLLLFTNNINATDTISKIDSILQKSYEYETTNSDSVIYYAKYSLQLSKENNLPKNEFESLLILAKANIKLGNYGKSVTYLTRANQIVELNNLSESQLQINILFGVAFLAKGFSKDALNYFLESMNLVSNKTSFYDKIDLYYYIGSTYNELDEIKNSHEYLKSSISIAISNKYPLGAFKSYILLSNSFSKIDSINKYLELANDIIIEHPESLNKKVVLRSNQALLNKQLGNLKLSKTQYLEAINISTDKGFQDHLSNLYNNYAYLLLAEKKPDSAAIVLNKALAIAKTIKSTDLQASIYDSYSDYFSSIRDYKNALLYKDSSIDKRNKYREEQRIQESLFLSAVFETKQKEKEIINKEKEILEQENQINRLWVMQLAVIAAFLFVIGLVMYLRQKLLLSRSRLLTVEKNKELEIVDAMIKGQDSEREQLSMDLHDGLAARLSNLRFFIDTNFYSNDKFTELTNYITSIHHNIRELSHRMQPIQLKRLGLKATIGELVDTINNSKRFKVDFTTDIENRLTEKMELYIFYIINELVNNATKHSKGNTISIQLYEDDNNSIKLSVEDNGKDFSPEESNKGSGLRNIESRVKYLGGKLLVESSGQNTMFFIEIPNKS